MKRQFVIRGLEQRRSRWRSVWPMHKPRRKTVPLNCRSPRSTSTREDSGSTRRQRSGDNDPVTDWQLR
jgi:hypothetical protein